MYILASKRNGTLYVGTTEDLAKRIVRHKGRRASKFTAKYDVRKLVYYEKHKSLKESLKREKQVKKWERQWKMRLIESQNPDWKDLFWRSDEGNEDWVPACAGTGRRMRLQRK